MLTLIEFRYFTVDPSIRSFKVTRNERKNQIGWCDIGLFHAIIKTPPMGQHNSNTKIIDIETCDFAEHT